MPQLKLHFFAEPEAAARRVPLAIRKTKTEDFAWQLWSNHVRSIRLEQTRNEAETTVVGGRSLAALKAEKMIGCEADGELMRLQVDPAHNPWKWQRRFP